MRRILFSSLAVLMVVVAVGFARSASAQCGTCVEEQDVSGDYHWFQNPNPEGMSDPHGNSVAGTCNSEHEWCVAPEVTDDVPDAEMIVELVALGDADAIRALLAAQPTYAQVNRERRALQLLSCGGDVMVHVPLSPALFELVAP